MIRFLLLAALVVTLAPATAQENTLQRIVEETPALKPYRDSLEQYEIKVLYSRIHRHEDGTVNLETHYWGADSTQYFYPASTVKMPVAALALQELNDLNVLGLDHDTPMFHGRGQHENAAPQTAVRFDTSATNGLPSVGHYLRKIFLTSDNDAYVRLFEWLGPTKIHRGLTDLGLHDFRLIHRVGVGGFDTLTHRYLNPVRFSANFQTHYQIGERFDPYYNPLPQTAGQFRGVAYTRNGQTINEPFDFSHKNYLSVRHLHDLLVRIILPEAVPENQRLRLTVGQRQLLLEAMAQRPRESASPRYDKPDNYVKFWLYGDQPEETKIPDHLRIYNKVGWAYGYLTDAAYIHDEQTGAEFIVVGTIHTNRNRTYNDGVYEYEGEGMPFFGVLGRALMDFERAN